MLSRPPASLASPINCAADSSRPGARRIAAPICWSSSMSAEAVAAGQQDIAVLEVDRVLLHLGWGRIPTPRPRSAHGCIARCFGRRVSESLPPATGWRESGRGLSVAGDRRAGGTAWSPLPQHTGSCSRSSTPATTVQPMPLNSGLVRACAKQGLVGPDDGIVKRRNAYIPFARPGAEPVVATLAPQPLGNGVNRQSAGDRPAGTPAHAIGQNEQVTLTIGVHAILVSAGARDRCRFGLSWYRRQTREDIALVAESVPFQRPQIKNLSTQFLKCPLFSQAEMSPW